MTQLNESATLRERLECCMANAWSRFMTAPYGTRTYNAWQECYVRLSTLNYEINGWEL